MYTKPRGYASIGLYHPKNSINVGSVLRAMGCFNASYLAIQGRKYNKAATDTAKISRCVPMVITSNLRSLIPFDCIPVAIELVEGSKSLVDYIHPPRAFYIFGPEDGSIPDSVLSWCKDIISIPTDGCLNLSASVNILLYDRLFKEEKAKRQKILP